MLSASGQTDTFSFLFFHEQEGLARYTVQAGRVRSIRWLCKVQGFWYIREHALAPTGRWMYFAFHADTVLVDLQRARWHWLARTTKLPDSLYRLAWSPNGRYLVGVAMGEFYRYSHLALFTAPPSKPRILVRVRHPDREVIQ